MTEPEQLTGASKGAFRHRGPAPAVTVTDLGTLSIPPKVAVETVTGFARSAGRAVVDGGAGHLIRMARSDLRDVPRPQARRSAEPPGGHASRRPVRERGRGRDIAVRVGAKTGKSWGRGRSVPREPSAEGEAVDTLRITRSVRRADLKAVGEVRRALRELMRHRCRTDAAEVAELLITELVTNALVHTDRGAEVHASLGAAAYAWRSGTTPHDVPGRTYRPPTTVRTAGDSCWYRNSPTTGAWTRSPWAAARWCGSSSTHGMTQGPPEQAGPTGFPRTARTGSAELLLQVLQFALQRVQPGNGLGVVLGGEVHRPGAGHVSGFGWVDGLQGGPAS